MTTLTDYKVRHLTVEDSNTNKAHEIWYSKMTPSERYELSSKFDGSIKDRLTASLNYIEDSM